MSVTHLAGPPDSDATVIEESWGDPERFAAIFDRYFTEIHRYLARRAGGKVASDLAAEVFLAAFAQRKRYDVARVCARPWLYGIATNMAAAHWREERRYYRALARTEAEFVTHSDEDGVTDRVSASAARPALASALAALAGPDRDVLLLVALADLGYQDVAQALGIPYGTVCSRLHRARRQIRQSLGGINPAAHAEESTHG